MTLIVGENDKTHVEGRQRIQRECVWMWVCECSPSQVSESGLKTYPLGQEQV